MLWPTFYFFFTFLFVQQLLEGFKLWHVLCPQDVVKRQTKIKKSSVFLPAFWTLMLKEKAKDFNPKCNQAPCSPECWEKILSVVQVYPWPQVKSPGISGEDPAFRDPMVLHNYIHFPPPFLSSFNLCTIQYWETIWELLFCWQNS